MALNNIFATTAPGNVPAAELDQNYNAIGAMAITACTATGSGTYVLTPNGNQPSVTSYANYQQFSFVAPATSTGSVTANVSGVGALPVYRPTGFIQANAGDIVAGYLYVLAYNLALNGGTGGFSIVNPFDGGVIAKSGTSVVVSNTGAESTLFSAAVPGGLLGAQNILSYTMKGGFLNNTGSNATFRIKAKYGGTIFYDSNNITYVTNTAPSSFQLFGTIGANNATNAQVGEAVGFAGVQDISGGPATSTSSYYPAGNNAGAVDSTTSQTFTITVTLGSAATTLTFTFYHGILLLQ